jgi:hypothetical protein
LTIFGGLCALKIDQGEIEEHGQELAESGQEPNLAVL